MPVLAFDEASEKLNSAVESLPLDDLIQVYSELNPESPAPSIGSAHDAAVVRNAILEHIRGGLEPEELVDLWNVVFPGDRAVYFDEEEGGLHFDSGDEEE